MVKAELGRDIDAVLGRMQMVIRDLETRLAADSHWISEFVPTGMVGAGVAAGRLDGWDGEVRCDE